MVKVLPLILLGLVAVSSALPRRHRQVPGGGRIVGGQPATEGQLPYQVSVQTISGSHFCGGSIISSHVVVTAAHCVLGDSPRDIRIVAGELDRSSASGHEQTVNVIRIAVHEKYNSPSRFFNDIALLFLSNTNPLIFNDYVKPVPLPTQEQQTNGSIIVSGWGATQQGGGLPNVLQWVELPTVDDAKCAQQYSDETLDAHMLCAGFDQGGKDSCQGDSGGPLVSTDGGYLAGIVSWGYGCAQAGYPGVNTEVSYFIDWINEIIDNHP